jgi:hypothetical protein
LVADSLEAEWNQTLRALAEAKDRYEKQRLSDRAGLTDQQRAAIMALAKDFPQLWNDPRTPQRERKRMARLLITDVTLLKSSNLRAQLRFKGGATYTLTLVFAQKPIRSRRAVIRDRDSRPCSEIRLFSGSGHRSKSRAEISTGTRIRAALRNDSKGRDLAKATARIDDHWLRPRDVRTDDGVHRPREMRRSCQLKAVESSEAPDSLYLVRMRSAPVIITKITRQNATEVHLIEDDNVVKAITTY